MNQASDYIKECPHGFPECSLCGKVSNSEQKIKEQAKSEGLDPSVWLRHKAKKELPVEATTA